MARILITGGTGFLGRAVVARVLADLRYQRVDLLVRPERGLSPDARVRALLQEIVAPSRMADAVSRTHAVPGDLTSENLGLSSPAYEELAASVDSILHLAASTGFNVPLDSARATNVAGTRRMLDFAKACAGRGGLTGFDYVSTAFVAGIHRREALETDLNRGQRFANTYEQSKFEAEIAVRACLEQIPTRIYRPSIIVGDSRTGYASSFSVIYWPLKVLSLPSFRFAIPGSRRARIDLVPVDFVADAIASVTASTDHRGATFHLTAGRGNEVRLGELARDAAQAFGRAPLPLIPVRLALALYRSPLRHLLPQRYGALFGTALPYRSYFEGASAPFNSEFTAGVLAARGIRVPRWRDYQDRIFAYCRDSSWGRSPTAPTYEYYPQAPAVE